MTTQGIYIYGIVPNFYSTDMFRSLENTEVYAIPFQNISALVSNKERVLLDSLDRESLGYMLVHHQKTIEDLMTKGFSMIIPMQLGTMVNSKDEVVKILENGFDLMIETLKKIEFLTEIDLVVSWADFSGVLKDFSMHPDIIELKEEVMRNTGSLSKIDQVKMGMLVQQKIDEKNKQIELNILDMLAAVSLDIKTHEVMNDQMITNSAFLVDRTKKEKFEQMIEQIDRDYKDLLNFKLVGPLPFYSFYTIEIKALNPEFVIQAKNELELGEETTESEIKKAFLGKARLYHPDSNLENGDEVNFNRINKAYHTLLDYSAAAKQLSKNDFISLSKENVNEHLTLVKIKE